MGLGSLSAEVIRSVDVDPSARPGFQSDDRLTSRFEDYLAEARSARRPARTDEPDQSEEPDRAVDEAAGQDRDEPKKPDSETEPEQTNADAPSTGTAAAANAMVASPAPPAAQPSGLSVQDTAAGTPQPQPGVLQLPQATPGQPTSQDQALSPAPAPEPGAAGPAERAAAISAAASQAPAPAGSETALLAAADSAARSGSVAGGDGAQPVSPAALEEVSLTAVPAGADESAVAADASQQVQTSPAPRRESRSDRTGVTTGGGREAKSDAPAGHSSRTEPQAAGTETVFQQKVRQSIEERREGVPAEQDRHSGKAPGSDGSSPAPAATRPKHATSSPASVMPDASRGSVAGGGGESGAQASALPRGPISLEGHPATTTATGSGGLGTTAQSGVAATGANDGLADTGGLATAHSASGTTGLSAVGQAVGDTLTAGLTGPDGPATAARVVGTSAAGPGRFQMALQLDPPELGQVRLNIQMQQQAIALHVDVESRAVARLIESRMPELHEALAAQGLRRDRTEVVVRSPSNGDAGLNQQQHRHGADAGQTSGDSAGGWMPGSGGGSEGGSGRGPWGTEWAADVDGQPWDAGLAESRAETESAGVQAGGEWSLNVVV